MISLAYIFYIRIEMKYFESVAIEYLLRYRGGITFVRS